jgi:hypothetical protein
VTGSGIPVPQRSPNAVFAFVRKRIFLRHRRLVAERDGASDGQTVAAFVGEKFARHLRLHLRLVIHVGENLDRRLAAFLSAEARHGQEADEEKSESDEKVAQHISPRKPV